MAKVLSPNQMDAAVQHGADLDALLAPTAQELLSLCLAALDDVGLRGPDSKNNGQNVGLGEALRRRLGEQVLGEQVSSETAS